MIRSLTPIILALVFVVSCGSTRWDTDNRKLQGESIAIGLSPDFRLENSSQYAGEAVVIQFQQGILDSLLQATLSRYVTGLSRGGQIDARYTSEPREADILLVIEKLEISRVYSLDFVLRGPVTRTRMNIAAYRGVERIFETRVSGSQNMAYTARNGRRFYWMKEEDRNNPHYQMLTLRDATNSALGKAYSSFFEQQ
ncbi:MAG: hypothetical protein ABR545_06715 [Cyclonatronaceae bacterium]